MKAKQRILIVVCVFLCGFFSGHVSHAQMLNKTFTDSEYGYSIRYPSSWKAGINRSGIVLSEVNSLDGQSGLQIRFQPSFKSLSEFVRKYVLDFQRQMQAGLIQKRSITIDRRNGYQISFQSNRGGKRYFLKSYVVPAEGRSGYYVFQSGTPSGRKARVEPILDQIAHSFRID